MPPLNAVNFAAEGALRGRLGVALEADVADVVRDTLALLRQLGDHARGREPVDVGAELGREAPGEDGADDGDAKGREAALEVGV